MFGFGKPARPQAVAFDIIGTVFPLEPLRPAVVALGLPPAGLEGWFAAGLRDAFALAAAGDFKPFAAVLKGALDQVLAEQSLRASDADKTALVDGLRHLSPRPGADEAFRTLREAGLAIIALSNGARSATRSLLEGAGLAALVEHVVSVDDVKFSKPRREVYDYAVGLAGVPADRVALVAVHPWDINGAKAAGLTTAFLAAERPFPDTMRKPDLQGDTLIGIARDLAAL